MYFGLLLVAVFPFRLLLWFTLVYVGLLGSMCFLSDIHVFIHVRTFANFLAALTGFCKLLPAFAFVVATAHVKTIAFRISIKLLVWANPTWQQLNLALPWSTEPLSQNKTKFLICDAVSRFTPIDFFKYVLPNFHAICCQSAYNGLGLSTLVYF